MEKLVEKAQKGDQSAYIELVRMYKTDLYRVAKARLDNIDDINDAINETLLKTYKDIRKLRNRKYFKTWMIKILINECNNIYNHYKRQTEIFDKIQSTHESEESTKHIDAVNDDIDFEIFIDSLKYDEKIIITLFYQSNYTVSEISDILNTNDNTVKSRLLRAKDKLRKELEGGKRYETRK